LFLRSFFVYGAKNKNPNIPQSDKQKNTIFSILSKLAEKLRKKNHPNARGKIWKRFFFFLGRDSDSLYIVIDTLRKKVITKLRTILRSVAGSSL